MIPIQQQNERQFITPSLDIHGSSIRQMDSLLPQSSATKTKPRKAKYRKLRPHQNVSKLPDAHQTCYENLQDLQVSLEKIADIQIPAQPNIAKSRSRNASQSKSKTSREQQAYQSVFKLAPPNQSLPNQEIGVDIVENGINARKRQKWVILTEETFTQPKPNQTLKNKLPPDVSNGQKPCQGDLVAEQSEKIEASPSSLSNETIGQESFFEDLFKELIGECKTHPENHLSSESNEQKTDQPVDQVQHPVIEGDVGLDETLEQFLMTPDNEHPTTNLLADEHPYPSSTQDSVVGDEDWLNIPIQTP